MATKKPKKTIETVGLELFPTGKAKGGKARAAALSPDSRVSIAKKAATARWGVKATHRGNFQNEFGIDVECYVLDDEQKTAVVSQRGLAATLGLPASGGGHLIKFLTGDKIAPYVGTELSEKIANPLIFQWSPAAANVPPMKVHGYDVTLLIDICKAVIRADADGKLLQRQKRIAQQAQIIIAASAKAGIKGLVYALAGYDATRAEVIQAFRLFIREEAREYEREFPEQLYSEWYRIYQLPRPQKNRPWKFKHLTVDHVYVLLAKSNGKILELTRAQKAVSSDRHAKLHQFLADVGVKALRTHLGQLLGIAMLSDNKEAYERNVERVFGTTGQRAFDFKKA